MTTETSAESQPSETTNEAVTSQDTAPSSTPTLTDPLVQPEAGAEAQTPEQIAATAAAAAAATSEPAAEAEAGKDDGATDAWKDAGLDDDLRKFVGDKTPAEIAKELKNAQALLGKKSVGIPGKDSTPEEQRAFHKARGVPDDETGYDFKGTVAALTEKAPEGWVLSPEMEANFRQAARQSNLSNGEAQQFAQHYLEGQFEQRKEFVATEVAATKNASAMLAKEWGPDRTVGEANFSRGMKAVGLPADSVDVFLAAYGGSAEARFNLVKTVAEIGRYQTEGGPIPGGAPPAGGSSMTKEQATAEISRIKADPVLSKAFTDVADPRHKEISREMGRLGKIERGIN